MSQEKTQLELEFHWLSRQQQETWARMNLLDPPATTRGRTFSLVPGETMFRPSDDYASFQPVRSGDKFVMTTADPTNLPLPDPELLELQWHLQRVLAIVGAADRWDDDSERDSDDQIDPLLAFEPSPETVDTIDIQGWLESISDDEDVCRASS
jgi:hypothetical protein